MSGWVCNWDIICFLSMSFGGKADIAVAHTNRDAFQSLIDAVKPEDFCGVVEPVDQKQYLDRILGTPTWGGIPRNDDQFFWIFENMDYKEWKRDLRTLVLSAPPERCLELAACYIVHDLQSINTITSPLYFFYRTTKSRHRLTCRSLGVHEKLIVDLLYTLLCQLIGDPNSSKSRSQSIVTAFLSQLLACRTESEFAEMVTGTPVQDVKQLLDYATLTELWDAFEKAVEVALNVGLSDIAPHTTLETPLNEAILSLTFIFDLDNPPIETWKSLLEHMRTLQRHLPTVKLLITNPPIVSDLGLRQTQSEVHIEYDKERKGFVSYCNLGSLIFKLTPMQRA